jgi:hypothetical protein
VHVSHVDGANRGEIRVAKFGPDGKAASYPLITKEAALAISEPLSRSVSAALTYEEGHDEPEPEPELPALPALPNAAPPVTVATESTKTVVVKKAAAKKAPLKTVAVKKRGQKMVVKNRGAAVPRHTLRAGAEPVATS